MHSPHLCPVRPPSLPSPTQPTMQAALTARPTVRPVARPAVRSATKPRFVAFSTAPKPEQIQAAIKGKKRRRTGLLEGARVSWALQC